jgi:hypothetical protein
MRDEEEERLVVAAPDIVHGVRRVSPGQLSVHGYVSFETILSLKEVPGTHVVTVGKSEVLLETMSRREVLGGVAQVPLPNQTRGVAGIAQDFGQCQFL